jgi:hypothetical protein
VIVKHGKTVRLRVDLTAEAADLIAQDYRVAMEENDGVAFGTADRYLAEALISRGLLDRHPNDVNS